MNSTNLTALVTTFHAAVLATVFGLATVTTPVVAHANVAPVAHVVTEDDPAWDCATMGNRVCTGPRGQ
jgi:hypothetical protein